MWRIKLTGETGSVYYVEQFLYHKKIPISCTEVISWTQEKKSATKIDLDMAIAIIRMLASTTIRDSITLERVD